MVLLYITVCWFSGVFQLELPLSVLLNQITGRDRSFIRGRLRDLMFQNLEEFFHIHFRTFSLFFPQGRGEFCKFYKNKFTVFWFSSMFSFSLGELVFAISSAKTKKNGTETQRL